MLTYVLVTQYGEFVMESFRTSKEYPDARLFNLTENSECEKFARAAAARLGTVIKQILDYGLESERVCQVFMP